MRVCQYANITLDAKTNYVEPLKINICLKLGGKLGPTHQSTPDQIINATTRPTVAPCKLYSYSLVVCNFLSRPIHNFEF